jgi:SAM-dependent methyltransferase
VKQGKHLDLGCGARPRNPYQYSDLSGIDIYRHPDLSNEVDFKLANLSIHPIPYLDNTFDAISAYDVIEHIPRVLNGGDSGTRFPFIDLMNEIWRTLKPNGMFYALTPAYPMLEAFKDPTHVNIITQGTHEYFCGEMCYAKPYGFYGKFEVSEVTWVHPRLNYYAEKSTKKTLRSLFRSFVRGKQKTHLLWQLRAIKPVV